MKKAIYIFLTKHLLYLLAWGVYAVFAWVAYSNLSLTVMLLSVALAMLGAWLYGFPGALATILLSIPFHLIMLRAIGNNPTIWHEAFNPFGISTQLVLSGAVAYLKHAKKRIDDLNAQLEMRVDDRTKELRQLQQYVVDSQETGHALISHVLMEDIGDSLREIKAECNDLLQSKILGQSAGMVNAAKLGEMVDACIENIQNISLVDHFLAKPDSTYSTAVGDIILELSDSIDATFHFDNEVHPGDIPRHVQYQLYRITREAITNAVRHGMAKDIEIHLCKDEHQWILSIVNDGNPMPAMIERGLGMKLMQHRAQQLGGELRLVTENDERTRLVCHVPLS